MDKYKQRPRLFDNLLAKKQPEEPVDDEQIRIDQYEQQFNDDLEQGRLSPEEIELKRVVLERLRGSR